jgi:large subunit ribosomal protein L5
MLSSTMHPLLSIYNEVSVPALKSIREYASVYQVPKITKVSVNVGVGAIRDNNKAMEDLTKLLQAITGQKPVLTKARTSISGFKIRQGMVVGVSVTLRGERMNDFLLKLVQITLPRTRDYRGVRPTSVTADGNLNVGIKDSAIFPEAPQDGAGHSLQVTVVSTARTLEESRSLFETIGFIFSTDAETTQRRRKVVRRKK